MLDNIPFSIKGFVKARYTDNNEVILDTTNDVLYGNMSTALAHALIGDSQYFLHYMGFGNGGAYVNSVGSVSYKNSLGGPSSLLENPEANLHNTIYVKKLSNAATPAALRNPLSEATIPSTGSSLTNYKDIVVTVVLGYNEPEGTGDITQSPIDNSDFIGISGNPITPPAPSSNTFVFNEIALYSGSSTVIPGNVTTSSGEVAAFVNSDKKLMLTHVIFHPVQKSANRQLEIIYTLRIQMGTIAP